MGSNIYKNTSLYMMLHGIIAILIGLAFIFATKELISTIVMAFGFIILLSGAIITWRSLLKNNQINNNYKYLSLLQGILLLALGFFITYNSEAMIKFIILFFGIWAALAGGYQLYYGIKSKGKFKTNNLLNFNGLILFIIGIIMIFKHDLFMNFIGTIIGIFSLIIGLISLFFAFLFHRDKQKFEDAEVIDE